MVFMYFCKNLLMEQYKKLPFDLDILAEAFDVQRVGSCNDLTQWLSSTFTLTATELEIIDDIHEEIESNGDYWNEEELKVQFIGTVFYVAKVKQKGKIRVYFERSISATINEYKLSVISDCIVATPQQFSSPRNPYFFLQEFKKGKGEKTDPEAQMLTAMLIAQALNNDNKPVYGSFVVGSEWRFTTLVGKNYCISKKFDATQKKELLQVIYSIRALKNLILDRL